MFRNKITAFLLVMFSMFSLATTVLAMSEENRKEFMKMSEQERKFLLMYFDEDELFVVSATRSLKSITRIAENVEVVSAEDIELMGAHNLADALKNVLGVQIQNQTGLSGLVMPHIQGSSFKHVAVFIDGIPYTNLSDNVAELGGVPVQQIEKIEIIKGPASSAWGSSLGGVINIITKSPGTQDKANGTLSASYGERNTGDYRAEIYGKKERFGYYLYAGEVQTDGMVRGFDVHENHLFTKFSYDPSSATKLLFTTEYSKLNRGDGLDGNDKFSTRFEYLNSSLALNSSLNADINLNLLLWASKFNQDFYFNEETYKDFYDSRYGASAKLTWRLGSHNMVFGSDYDDGDLKSNIISNGSHRLKKWAVYANDTIILDRLSITPGIRYDNIDPGGDMVSPTLGITYKLSNDILLRAYVARGFNAPPLSFTFGDVPEANPDLKPEKVWSYQIGAETTALKYLWLKLSAFRHEITDGIIREDKYENKEEVRRQGVEIQIKTVPVYNTVLYGGVSFINTKVLSEEVEVKGFPTYTCDIGLKYNDNKSFRALLTGHYTWWNEEAGDNAKYSSMIFDLNMIKSLMKRKESTLEAFLTGHNIFNGSQYTVDYLPNAGRWVEGGIRYKF